MIWFLRFVLRSRCDVHRAAVAQWLVHFSAHPQAMQQDRQLSGHRGAITREAECAHEPEGVEVDSAAEEGWESSEHKPGQENRR